MMSTMQKVLAETSTSAGVEKCMLRLMNFHCAEDDEEDD
jgi:hypothetical protein